MQTMITRVLTALALAVGLAGPAAAEPVSAADTEAVRSLVEAQLAAFAAEDSERAFGYAAPTIREAFGNSAERFMTMVRSSYPMVYRPSEVVFLRPEWVDGTLVQGVQMTDAGGRLWLAVYNLDRQPDRSWRIAGCSVRPQTGRLT